MGTVVLKGTISFLLFVRYVYVDVDRKLSFFVFFFVPSIYRAMYPFHIYPNTLSYQVEAG